MAATVTAPTLVYPRRTRQRLQAHDRVFQAGLREFCHACFSVPDLRTVPIASRVTPRKESE